MKISEGRWNFKFVNVYARQKNKDSVASNVKSVLSFATDSVRQLEARVEKRANVPNHYFSQLRSTVGSVYLDRLPFCSTKIQEEWLSITKELIHVNNHTEFQVWLEFENIAELPEDLWVDISIAFKRIA